MFRARKISRFSAVLIISFIVFCVLSVLMISPSDAKSIKIGVIGPMKDIQGKHHWISANMAADEINKAGGVKVGKEKYTIELIKVDSNETASVPDAVNAFQRVIGDVDFMVGGFRSESVLAMMEVMADNKKVFLSCGPSSSKLALKVAENYDRYKYWFRGGPANTDSSISSAYLPLNMVANTIRKELGIKKPKIALLADKALYCEPGIQLIQSKAPEVGIEVAGVWRPSFTASSVMPELTAIKNAGTHIIFTYSAGPAGLAYSKQEGELQIPAAMIGLNVEAQRLTHWQQTGGLCNYNTMLAFFAPVEATSRSLPFYNNFVKQAGEAPTSTAAAYDGVYILKEAAERAGTIASEAMVKSLEKTDFGGAQGRIAFYTAKEQWPHDVRFGPGYITFFYVQWRDGEQKVVWPDGDASINKIRYKGTVDYKLPPWMVDYWKKAAK